MREINVFTICSNYTTKPVLGEKVFRASPLKVVPLVTVITLGRVLLDIRNYRENA